MHDDSPYRPPPEVAEDWDGGYKNDAEYLRDVATRQRHVVFVVLAQLGLVAALIGMNAAGIQNPMFDLAHAGAAILVFALGAVAVYRLAAIFRGKVVAVIYVLGVLVPCLGLLLLLSVSQKATSALQAHGVKVGLLGADPSSIN